MPRLHHHQHIGGGWLSGFWRAVSDEGNAPWLLLSLSLTAAAHCRPIVVATVPHHIHNSQTCCCCCAVIMLCHVSCHRCVSRVCCLACGQTHRSWPQAPMLRRGCGGEAHRQTQHWTSLHEKVGRQIDRHADEQFVTSAAHTTDVHTHAAEYHNSNNHNSNNYYCCCW